MTKYFLAAIAIVIHLSAIGQIVAGADIFLCSPDSVTLNATATTQTGQTEFLSDDEFSDTIPMGFSFLYFGNTYSELVISSNNYVTFDLSSANGASGWQITGAAPGAGNTPNNSILAPFQDVNPAGLTSGPIFYGTYGTAPNRVFTVTFCELPMFSCTSLQFSSQLKIFEATNHIEMHIQSKPTCTTWNNGYAIQGLIDATGSANSVFVPGRNFPNVWTATSEGWIWFPTGISYIPSNINFAPTILTNLVSNVVIEWLDDTGNLVSTGSSLTVYANQSTYYVARTLICGLTQYLTDTVYIDVNQLGGTVQADTVVCYGDNSGSLSITPGPNAGNPPLSYNWSNGATSQNITGLSGGMYTYTITDNIGCEYVDSALVFEPDSIYGTATIYSDTCGAGVGRIETNFQGGFGILQYDWSNGANSADNIGLNAGTYTLTVSDDLGCTLISTYTVGDTTLTVSFDTTFVQPDYCSENNGQVTLSSIGGAPPYSYLWPGGQQDSVVNNLSGGTYEVTITDKYGCSGTGTVIVPVTLPPLAVIAVSEDTVNTGDPQITFSDTTISGIVEWYWEFGDGTGSTGQTTTHSYNNIGNYFVELLVVDSVGCEDTAYVQVFVVEEFFYFIPNGFTPNGDDINEEFLPVIEGVELDNYRMGIYGRNGQLIFESTDQHVGWNGTYHNTGKDMPSQVYTFRIEFVTPSGRDVVEMGTLTLVR